ncbi:hypothetical protein [Tropicimonas sediminicola]|uniref:Uncharacterized protein n=1 Tax=Tropicimonas sediminicola TaxID=1031541 RepID=A0A239HSX0_9RHOB|nr:hypothetical protein [Tropicimonas sediminicola]SNS84275.1 hypothetical protein SAMN05421757_1046 [Tropicimonas sediminicola]
MRFVLFAAIMAASPAFAETFSSGAVGTGTSSNEPIPIAEGHIVMRTSGSYEMFEVEAGHPLEGAKGPCFGAVEIKGGEVSGGGNCVYETSSGDKAVMVWKAMGLGADGALTGEWSVSGGTGAWTGATGGGTFSSLTDPNTGKFVNTITGDITVE